MTTRFPVEADGFESEDGMLEVVAALGVKAACEGDDFPLEADDDIEDDDLVEDNPGDEDVLEDFVDTDRDDDDEDNELDGV